MLRFKLMRLSKGRKGTLDAIETLKTTNGSNERTDNGDATDLIWKQLWSCSKVSSCISADILRRNEMRSQTAKTNASNTKTNV